MIIQGSNKPIIVSFDEAPADISICLHNEIEIFKRWGLNDLTLDEDGVTYSAPITQAESITWEEGPVEIDIKWAVKQDSELEGAGYIRFMKVHERIVHWADDTQLTGTWDNAGE